MPLTNLQLAQMRATQEANMIDVIDIEHRIIVDDEYGDVTYSGALLSNVPCGFDFVNGIEKYKGQIIIVDYDADVRLALDVEIGINDIVTLKELAGVAHNEVFQVFEYPRFGTSVQHIQLKRANS